MAQDNLLEPLDDDLAALLADERTAPDPDAQVQERVWNAVAVATTAGVAGGAAAGGLAGWLKSKGMAVLLAAAAGGAVGAVGMYQWGPSVVTVVQVPVAVPMPVHQPGTPSAAAMQPAQVPAALPVVPKVARRTPPRAEPTGVEREAALLGWATTALHRGDAAGALGALGKHRSEFPDGMMAQERDAMWVVALSRAGKSNAAQDAAKAFEKRWPGSMHQAKVQEAAGGLPEP